MREVRPEPCLSLLKDLKFCDFYEAAYLFGNAKVNKGLEIADIRPIENNPQSVTEYNLCQRPFILRRASRSEHSFDLGITCFPKNEREIINFLNEHWENTRVLKTSFPKGFKSLFFPLPTETIEFEAIMHVRELGISICDSYFFRFFHFQNLIHEIIFSNKMHLEYCTKLKINMTTKDEYCAYDCKSRNLVIKTIAYYLLKNKPELRWNLQAVIEDDIMKSALQTFTIPKSCRLIKDEVKKIIPSGLVKTGTPNQNKWNSNERLMHPLLIYEGLEIKPDGCASINYQFLRIILRTLIIANFQHKVPVASITVDKIINDPLIEYYRAKLTPKGLEFLHKEASCYIQFQRGAYSE